MTGIDISEWQSPGTVNFAGVDFVIIRTSHGLTQDKVWRQHFNDVVAAGKPLGLYHFAEDHDPGTEASFFVGLVGFLAPAQVHMGFWLDVESGQNESWVDRFRSIVGLPFCGVYSNLNGFNVSLGHAYDHFSMNWLALPTGTTVPGGWTMPDHILEQYAEVGGVDQDRWLPAQPLPGAWP